MIKALEIVPDKSGSSRANEFIVNRTLEYTEMVS